MGAGRPDLGLEKQGNLAEVPKALTGIFLSSEVAERGWILTHGVHAV